MTSQPTTVMAMATAANVRALSLGGFPHQPTVSHRAPRGPVEAEPDAAAGDGGAVKDHPGHGDEEDERHQPAHDQPTPGPEGG